MFHRKMYLFLKLCYNSVTFFSTRCIRGHSNIMFFHSFSCSAPFFTSLYLQLDQHFLTSPNEPRKPKVKVNTTQIWNLERSSQPVDATIFTTLADSNKNYLKCLPSSTLKLIMSNSEICNSTFLKPCFYAGLDGNKLAQMWNITYQFWVSCFGRVVNSTLDRTF